MKKIKAYPIKSEELCKKCIHRAICSLVKSVSLNPKNPINTDGQPCKEFIKIERGFENGN